MRKQRKLSPRAANDVAYQLYQVTSQPIEFNGRIMTTLEKIIFVKRTANQLMQEHGLIEDGWQFQIASTKNSVGRCWHRGKIIEYSKYFLDESADQIVDTILHEIAHALVGEGHGHDDVWKRKCVQIGAKPERVVEDIQSKIKYNFVIKCVNPNCQRPYKGYRHRLKREAVKRMYCMSCGASVKAFKLVYKD